MGYVNAQYCLGYFYEMHSEIENSLNESFYWYLKASKQGDSQAMLAVAYYYGHGLGTTKMKKRLLNFIKRLYSLVKKKLIIILEFVI